MLPVCRHVCTLESHQVRFLAPSVSRDGAFRGYCGLFASSQSVFRGIESRPVAESTLWAEIGDRCCGSHLATVDFSCQLSLVMERTTASSMHMHIRGV